jgi:hypothetical protein
MKFIPKIKQIIGGKIPGILKDPLTGLTFNGPFVQDFLGNFFKGTKITKDSKPLEFVPDEQLAQQTLGLVNEYRSPTPVEYSKGLFIRYFVKDGRSGIVVEVGKDQYLRERKQNKLYRRTLKVQWYVTGDVEDKIINGYIYPGTRAKNQDVIDQAEKELPGIGQQILKDPTQFVRK